jgi:protein-S-isoprenylcysteine O-methyltransferase Ste14
MDGDMLQTGRSRDTARGVIRWLIRETLGTVFVGVILFAAAGRLDWPWGWAMVGVYVLWVAANALILIPTSPDLLAERADRKRSTESWDLTLLSIIGVATLSKYVLAGLDARFGWTAPLPLWLQVAALIVTASGFGLVTWGMAANAFFAFVNRIQDDRGHTVATGGPYRFVRHPGYLGTVLSDVAAALLLGSLWALIPGALAALLMIVRTGLEDRMLHEKLPGYADYAQQTRYRLIPGVW